MKLSTQQYLKISEQNLRQLSAIAFIFTVTVLSSCSEFVQIGPPKTEIVSEAVFSNDASAISTVRGIFAMMMTDQSFTNGQLEYYAGLSADELTDHTGDAQIQQFYRNELVATNTTVLGVFWSPSFKYISNANAILEGLEKSTGVTAETKALLTGEAKFIRAYCHFFLTNLFGDIPYVNSTDYRVNSVLTRKAQADVYNMIVEDLMSARELLPADFTFANGQRIEPNKGAASALLARVYLYQEQWTKALEAAGSLIDDNTYSLEQDLDSVFLSNSRETIWQLSPVTPENSTPQARLFLINIAPNYVSLTDEFYASFEDNDKRKDSWTQVFNDGTSDFYFAYKYKIYSSDVLTEYSTVLRLAEQYLIHAEANANLGNLAQGISDVDFIRARAGLPLIATTNPDISQAELLLAIEKERRFEFFTEGGHRWLDLKRTNRATTILGALKDSWLQTDALYPIPQTEINLDPALTQNDGYDQ